MFYDIRESTGISEIISLENDNLNIMSTPFSLCGVRYVNKGIGFVSATKYSDSLLEKAKKLAKLSDSKIKFPESKTVKLRIKTKFKEDPSEISLSEKIKLVKQVSSMLEANNVSYKNVLMRIARGEKKYSDSNNSEIIEPISNIVFYVTISGGKNLQTSFFSFGTHGGYETVRKHDFQSRVDKLLKKHDEVIHAKKASAGRYPIVLDPALSGVFFHEAVGHACEADAILNKASVLYRKLGKKIAPSILTMADNPKLNGFGHYKYDDEGERASNTELIKEGYLVNYLHSKETAARMKTQPTGNGRVQNSETIPIPRMSNTIIKKGDSNLKEMIREVKNGMYLIGSKGGVVDTATGNFLFNAEYGYLIKNGEKKEMVSDVSLSGNILETLNKIRLIGKKSVFLPRTGYCGKMGQSVPVDEKAPHIMLKEAIVGGR